MATPHFPRATLKKMQLIGVSENDVLDVFNTGEHSKNLAGYYMTEKRYPSYGYLIDLSYTIDNYTGKYVITFVRKRKIV